MKNISVMSSATLLDFSPETNKVGFVFGCFPIVLCLPERFFLPRSCAQPVSWPSFSCTFGEKNLDAFDPFLKASGETYITHGLLREVTKQAKWIIVLTNKAFYKFDVDTPLANPRKKKELLDIHRHSPWGYTK